MLLEYKNMIQGHTSLATYLQKNFVNECTEIMPEK